MLSIWNSIQIKLNPTAVSASQRHSRMRASANAAALTTAI